MNKDFVKELDVLIWKFLKISNELSIKQSYNVKFIGIRKITQDTISANFLFQYGFPVADEMIQIDIPFEKLEDIDSLVKEIIDNKKYE